MPMLIFQALDSASHTKQRIENQTKEITQLRQQIEKNHDGTIWAILVSAVMVTVAVLFQ